MVLGCGHVWLWTSCLCCLILLVSSLCGTSVLILWFQNWTLHLGNNLFPWSIEELVEVGRNGRLFSTSSDLADELLVCIESHFTRRCHIRCYLKNSFSAFLWRELVFCLLCLVNLTCHVWIVFCWAMSHQMLFKGFPSNCDELNSLRKGAGASVRWATEWEEHANPLLMEASFLFFSVLLFSFMISRLPLQGICLWMFSAPFSFFFPRINCFRLHTQWEWILGF